VRTVFAEWASISPDALARIGRNGAGYAKTNYDPDVGAARIIGLLIQALAHVRGGAQS
jgi:hypothetical protein